MGFYAITWDASWAMTSGMPYSDLHWVFSEWDTQRQVFPCYLMMYSFVFTKIAKQMRSHGFSLRSIAKCLNVTKSTIHRRLSPIVAKTAFRRPLCPPKCFDNFITESPFCTITSYKNKLRKVNINVSRTTVWRWLRQRGFTKGRTYPGKEPTETLAIQRGDFSRKIRNIDITRVICVDETSWYDVGIPRLGWRKAGIRLKVPMRRTTGKRYSLITAMTYSGEVHWQLHQGSINSRLFANFVESIPAQWKAGHLLMDNVAFHKSLLTREALTKRGLHALFTSPYSPEWNPAEMLFSFLKRQQLAMNLDLPSSSQISMLLKQLKPGTSQRFFEHCWLDILSGKHR